MKLWEIWRVLLSPPLAVPLRRTEPISLGRRLLRGASESGIRDTTIVVHGLWVVPLVSEDGGRRLEGHHLCVLFWRGFRCAKVVVVLIAFSKGGVRIVSHQRPRRPLRQ